jgi:chromosome segregation ATPase
MLKNFRKALDQKKVSLQLLVQAEKRHSERLRKIKKELKEAYEAREIFQKASLLTQNNLAEHLSSIVTKAIRTVWYDRDLSFHTEFVERRNTTECDMWLEEDGFKYSLLDSRGYGVVDVVSFALKVAYILLHKTDNVLVIDEPFRNLDESKHELVSLVIKELADELNIQFIITTHVPALKEYADKSFEITQSKGVSRCA